MMKHVEILEELFKINSLSRQPMEVLFYFELSNVLATRMRIGDYRYQFNVPFDKLEENYDIELKIALTNFKNFVDKNEKEAYNNFIKSRKEI